MVVRAKPDPCQFLFPDREERTSGKVRIKGVLVEPVPDRTDMAVIEALKEIAKCDDTDAEKVSPEWEKELDFKMGAALDDLPAKYNRHQFLHRISAFAFRLMKQCVDAKQLDDQILSMESQKLDVRRLKHFRKIFRNGSIFHAVKQAHGEMIKDIFSKDLAQNPGAWEGYSEELIAYAIHLLRESIDTFAEYEVKRKAMGFGWQFKQTNTGFMELYDEWKKHDE
ncbi:hypothetical protein TI39_contig602g00004 [Zymoseptoria brevis]|uniref:Uncharacterized protein n=1 Tax=Zymoseptoria brevis TaxID=1047168 RepID=A0A0F4GI55_9PEZI|nr:hypothetical protein TI39_contig602g00004 [Zymoseptoria brevis]